MFQRNFSSFNPHLQGSRIELSSNQHDIASFGSDDIIFRVDNLMGQTNTLDLRNQEKLEITSFVIHPKIENTFVFGTSSGLVKILRPIHHLELHKGDILFKGSKSINHLSFSNQGRYLFISSEDSTAVVFCTKSRRLYNLPKQHEGIVNSGSFCNEDMIFSIGSQGKLHLYSIKGSEEQQDEEDISDDPFAQMNADLEFTLIDSYKIASEAVSKKFSFLNAVYSEWQQREKETKVILTSGQKFLQLLILNNEESTYQIQKRVSEQQQILNVQPLGRGQNQRGITFLTTTETTLSIWNYTKMQKIMSVDIFSELKGVITSIKIFEWKGMPSFAFVVDNLQSNGKIYLFGNHQLLNVDDKEPEIIQQIIEGNKQKEEKSQSQRRFISIKDKLIPLYPQFTLDKAYEEHQKARFLFYNSVGCVIQRTDSETSTLELQLHDKSKPKKFKINVKNRSFGMFALKQKAFLCSTTNVLMFQEEKQVKDNAEGWQVIWQNIQDVALGGSWIAACNNEQIRIFDYAGNELHCICFDRRFVTMEAYQDLLVIVYHASLPMWGCQSLKMRVYKVTSFEVTVERDVLVPIKPNSILKWFGFSEEGMIFCQDSLEIVRGYSFKQDLWQTVFSLQGKYERLFIQHIQGGDIFGFRIEHREDQKEEPKVLPRSLPRKIAMDWSELSIDFLSRDESNYLKKMMLKNLLIEHQEFRYQNWYKLRYSRRKDHVWFQQSKTIKSEEQIKTLKLQNDIQLHDYLQKYLTKNDLPTDKLSKISMSLILICEREAHFEETKEKIRKMLTTISNKHVYLPQKFEEMSFKPVIQPAKCKEKLNEINILEQILSLMGYS